MEVQAKGDTVQFFGFLDERTSIETLSSAVEKAATSSPDKTVRLDFSGVKRANSVGILAWAKFIDSTNHKLIYINCPEWLVEQFNLCDLLKKNSFVESIQAPFYCLENDSHEVVTLVIGRDIPVQVDYSDVQMTLKNEAGALLEADFDPPEYFHFIARNVEKFRGGR